MDAMDRMKSMMDKVGEAKEAVVDKMAEAKDKVTERVMEAKEAVSDKMAEVRGKVMGDADKESKPLDAIELLKADHQLVNGIFDRLLPPGAEQGDKAADKGEASDREGLFSQLKYELDTHAEVEEQIFYPVMERIDGFRAKMQEAHQEHDLVKQLLVELSQAPAGGEGWTAQLKVLQENVQHHVKEEETEIFPAARKALSEDELRRLGAKLEAAKKADSNGASRATQKGRPANERRPAAERDARSGSQRPPSSR